MNRPCPICSSSQKTLLYKQKFNNSTIVLMDNYGVVACKDCGFTYADGIPSQEEFNKYYSEMAKYEFNYQDGTVSQDYLTYFTKVADFIVSHLKDKKAKILDVGCASGDLLAVLKSKGYSNLSGIEPSLACVKSARKLYGVEVTVDNVYDFRTSERFDLIILSAVLEHLLDLRKAIEKIKSLLKDDGLLFIEVPDVERFDSHIPAPFQQFNAEHLNFFSRNSIKNLLASFGIKTIEMQQQLCEADRVTMPDIFVLAQKTNEKKLGISHDNVSEASIRKYIDKCSELGLSLNKRIQDKLLNKGKIIVWGVGTHTKQLLDAGLDVSKISYFVDSNSRYLGKKLHGIEIRLPADIKEEIPILISTHSYQQEIADQIKNVLKLNNEIIKIYQ